ncbi:MAG TPA: Crp/Fnr family transcriptional regulator [Pyrinomonadaceae bacterium]|jgi:CRP-like cAMP-binding protein
MSTHDPAQREVGNRLLSKLTGEELEALGPHMQQVSLAHAEPLILPQEPVRHVYFPINALASLVTILEDGSTVEAGSVGREGMVGIPVLLNAGMTPMQTLVQIPGEAIKIKAEAIKAEFDKGGQLHNLLNRYVHTLFVVGSQSAACYRRHHIEARLARWLLMSSDGVASCQLALTQEFLATMLGVRRSGVTEAALNLQNDGLITYNRGRVHILERERLEECACECYRMVRDEYERLLG